MPTEIDARLQTYLLEEMDVLREIGFHGDDMGPRVLRTTYARRQLRAGATVEDVAGLLGIQNARMVERLVRMTPTHTGYTPV